MQKRSDQVLRALQGLHVQAKQVSEVEAPRPQVSAAEAPGPHGAPVQGSGGASTRLGSSEGGNRRMPTCTPTLWEEADAAPAQATASSAGADPLTGLSLMPRRRSSQSWAPAGACGPTSPILGS